MNNLRSIGMALVLAAFAAGALAVWLWMSSNAAWRAHQETAYLAGVRLHTALQQGHAPGGKLTVRVLSDTDAAHAETGAFHRITGAPQPTRVTNVPIAADLSGTRRTAPLTLAILSPDLVYKLSRLPSTPDATAAETTGAVFRLLASFCTDPMVLAHFGASPWIEVQGAEIWGCAAAPKDLRLLAVLLAILALAVLITVTINISASFSSFAEKLRSRQRLGGPQSYETPGPQELQDIVAAVNRYLETERAQLESRAAVLSGVSHDLGTPATRLRLRTALIPDAELRGKLEADIDSMTGMIESVLTYTRAEMSVETPRKLSLSSLIDALIADYQDMGSAVRFRQSGDVVVTGGRSVFMSRQGQGVMSGDREVIVTGRPIALQRAITNLIDNAIKYGRRATVALETDAETAQIVVEDEGCVSSAKDIEHLMAPFQRGDNTTTIAGHGLGLTIVATIAKLHGGELTFEDTPHGLAARLTIQRT